MLPTKKIKRLRLTNDAVFKFVFTESNSSLLRLINAVLQWSTPITKIKVSPNESIIPGDKSKQCRFDLRAFDQNGREYNIELQMQKQNFYCERALFYWSRVYGEKIHQGENYNNLQPVIGIHFLGFEIFKNSDGYHSHAQIIRKDVQNNYTETLTNDFNLHFIEMPKCDKIKS